MSALQQILAASVSGSAEPGQVVFTTTGASTWECPPGVSSVCVVAVGAGGGGGFADMMKDHMNKEEVSVEGGDDEKAANFHSKDSLMDKVHVHVDQGVKATDSKVVVDIDVTDNVVVSTEAGSSKSSESVGLSYKFDY